MVRYVLDLSPFRTFSTPFGLYSRIPVRPVVRERGFALEVIECDLRRDVYRFLCALYCVDFSHRRLVFYFDKLPISARFKRVC